MKGGDCGGCGVYAWLIIYTVEPRNGAPVDQRSLALCRECRRFANIFEVIRRVMGADWRLSLNPLPEELKS